MQEAKLLFNGKEYELSDKKSVEIVESEYNGTSPSYSYRTEDDPGRYHPDYPPEPQMHTSYNDVYVPTDTYRFSLNQDGSVKMVHKMTPMYEELSFFERTFENVEEVNAYLEHLTEGFISPFGELVMKNNQYEVYQTLNKIPHVLSFKNKNGEDSFIDISRGAIAIRQCQEEFGVPYYSDSAIKLYLSGSNREDSIIERQDIGYAKDRMSIEEAGEYISRLAKYENAVLAEEGASYVFPDKEKKRNVQRGIEM